MSKALELVKGVRELLAEPRAWTRGACARDPQGNIVGGLDPNAVCWCLSGALERVRSHKNWQYSSQVEARTAAINAMRGVMRTDIITFNDRVASGHEGILTMLDKVVEELEKDEQIRP